MSPRPKRPPVDPTLVRRRELLDEYFDVIYWVGGDRAETMSRLENEYGGLLPITKLSRCPFTSEEVLVDIDINGLDGLWWNYEDPVRDVPELPETYFAFTGSLRLGKPLEKFPFLCVSGPEVPFLVHRMIRHPSIRAVISQVKIGPHTGYPIFYFVDPTENPLRFARFNEWGSHMYWTREYGGFWWDRVFEDDEELEFELEPSIEKGKLQWISPGDESLELQSDPEGCPYLNLPGDRNFQRIQNGVVWKPDLVPPTRKSRRRKSK